METVNSKLVMALETARTTIQEQQEVLERLHEDGLEIATIVQLGDKSVVISSGGQLRQALTPNFSVKLGDQVAVYAKTGQIVEKSSYIPCGNIAAVKKVISANLLEIAREGAADTLAYYQNGSKIEVGDRVMLDPTEQVVLRNLGQVKQPYQFSGQTNVRWVDIGGLENAKRELIEIFELPYRNPAIFKAYNKKPARGVLLYGPPGCGKTMLGKASATSIREVHKGEGAETGFIYIKGPEILSKFVGIAEETVRSLFIRARKHKERFGYPATIFIDEADAILAKRGSGISSDVEKTIVPAFLAEMDGLDENAAVVLLATNRPNTLDDAVTRDGRVDRAIRIERPDETNSKSIFELHLKGVPLVKSTAKELAERAALELFSPKRILYRFIMNSGETHFTLSNLCNGAMIAGIVGRASSIAMYRNIENKSKDIGVTVNDIVSAVDRTFFEVQDLNHRDDISAFLEPIKDSVREVQKVRA